MFNRSKVTEELRQAQTWILHYRKSEEATEDVLRLVKSYIIRRDPGAKLPWPLRETIRDYMMRQEKAAEEARKDDVLREKISLILAEELSKIRLDKPSRR